MYTYTLKNGDSIAIEFTKSESDNRYVESDFTFTYLYEQGWGKLNTNKTTGNLETEIDFFSSNVDFDDLFDGEGTSFEDVVVGFYLLS